MSKLNKTSHNARIRKLEKTTKPIKHNIYYVDVNRKDDVYTITNTITNTIKRLNGKEYRVWSESLSDNDVVLVDDI